MIRTNSEPIHSLDIQQLEWALCAGKVDESSLEENQPVVAETISGTGENPPVCTTVLDQITAIEKMLNQQIALFRNEFAVFILEQLNQQIALFRDEFAVFIQAQVNQEKALLEKEWQKRLVEHESKMLAEMREMRRQSIIGEFTTYFQLLAEQLQNRDHLIHKEISLLKEQLSEMHQYQEHHKEEDLALEKQWNQKNEECQRQLINCMQHIQIALEHIRVSGIDNKRQEDFFLKEIALIKCEVANLQQSYQMQGYEQLVIDAEPCEDYLSEKNEDIQQVLVVEQDMIKKKKRRHRRG